MIVGIGIDISDVGRIKKLIERYGDKFLSRIFTEKEVRECRLGGKNAYQRFSARFAAKEAAVKALGAPKRAEFTEYEIIGTKGPPQLKLKGIAKKLLDKKGAKRTLVSFAHLRDYVVAVVVLEADDQ